MQDIAIAWAIGLLHGAYIEFQYAYLMRLGTQAGWICQLVMNFTLFILPIGTMFLLYHRAGLQLRGAGPACNLTAIKQRVLTAKRLMRLAYLVALCWAPYCLSELAVRAISPDSCACSGWPLYTLSARLSGVVEGLCARGDLAAACLAAFAIERRMRDRCALARALTHSDMRQRHRR